MKSFINGNIVESVLFLKYKHVCFLTAAFWGDIALDEEDLRLFPDLRDDEQNSVHTSDVDSGRNTTNPPAPVWVKLARPVAGNASSSSDGPRRRRAAAQKLLRRRRAATSRPERMWPDGIIPYVISGNFTGDFSIFNLFWFYFFSVFL